MAPTVLDVHPDEGQLRVTFREPVGRVDAPELVRAAVRGTYDHDGVRPPRPGESLPDALRPLGGFPYSKGDAVGEVHLYIAGARFCHVPADTYQLRFLDGALVNMPGAGEEGVVSP
jgi:hypothetical protein